MYYYIELKDVIANAFIVLLENTKRREVLFKDLEEYGLHVINLLNHEKEQYIFIMSNEEQSTILQENSDLFIAFEKDGFLGFKLKKHVQLMDLWGRFCSALSLKVIRAFQSGSAKEILINISE